MSDNETASTESTLDESEAKATESEADTETQPNSESDGEPESETAALSVVESVETYQEHVEETDPEQLTDEFETLAESVTEQQATIEEQQETIEEHEETIGDLESSLKRQQADFQNYKKRMEKRRKQERKRATEGLVTRLIAVRDNLQRGLEQDGDIREGVETTLSQFDDVLEAENVSEIAPDPGDAVDPQRHEVLMRVESDQPANSIDEVHRLGYEMADKVLREAQVTVSEDKSEREQATAKDAEEE